MVVNSRIEENTLENKKKSSEMILTHNVLSFRLLLMSRLFPPAPENITHGTKGERNPFFFRTIVYVYLLPAAVV